MNTAEYLTVLMRVLKRLQHAPGYVGRSAARKFRRRMIAHTVVVMNGRLARLGPDDICLDLGANVGVFTEIMARTGAQVHAFEPDPETFKHLQQRVGNLPNVTLHKKAVGATAGSLPLFRSAEFETSFERGSLASSLYHRGAGMMAVEGAEIEVVSFDELLQSLGHVALIKMDIEGAEWEILERVFAGVGAKSFDALFVETHERCDASRSAQAARMRDQAAAIAAPYINLYWP